MSSRNRSKLFVPDERGLGGAMEIAQEYQHFFSSQRARSAAPSYAAEAPSAQQLSYQRAAKNATSDTVAHDHLVRLGHMYNRIAAPSTSSRQQQQQRSPQPGQARPGSLAADICLWLPRRHGSPPARRPSTAPEQRSSSSSTRGPSSSSSSQQYIKDWPQLKAAAHPQPQPPVQPVQLPPSRYYIGPNLLPSVQHRLLKASLMNDILTRQLFKAGQIKQLCVAAVHCSPLEHRGLLRQVAAEVLQELEVPYTTELDV